MYVCVCPVMCQYAGEFSLVDISRLPIIVGMVASAAALPLNLLIALLFRRSLVRVFMSYFCELWHVRSDEIFTGMQP